MLYLGLLFSHPVGFVVGSCVFLLSLLAEELCVSPGLTVTVLRANLGADTKLRLKSGDICFPCSLEPLHAPYQVPQQDRARLS